LPCPAAIATGQRAGNDRKNPEGLDLKLADHSILTELTASGRLPSPTGVALSILELSRDPDTNTEDMAEVLQGDPALAGQILKYANRADSGSRKEITSLNDALVRLGMSVTRQLCLGFSVLSNARSGPCPTFDYHRYWAHSLAMAVSAQAIGRRLRVVAADEAFTCGLLCCIGRLGLASVYPLQYSDLIQEWDRGTGHRLKVLERREFSTDHSLVSSVLFQDWGLPDYFGEAAELFEEDETTASIGGSEGKSQARKLAKVLHFASLAADICLETGVERHPLVLEFMKVGAACDFTEDEWAAMYNEILAEWGRMGRVLNILTGTVPPMEDLIRRARHFRETIPDRKTRSEQEQPGSRQQDQEQQQASSLNRDCGMEVLVATDSPVDMRILEKKLAAQGHHLTQAVDGKQALELALKISPQLILTDWMMPEMDGLELARTLRLSQQAAGTYIIVMTAQEGSDQLVEAFDSGIDDYVTKPINHRVLSARMRAARRIIDMQEEMARSREELRVTLAELAIVNRQQQVLNLQLEQMAMEDQLTELPNRRAGLTRLDQEWSRSDRTGEPLLCMVLDIDFFKKVNDTYGHDAGDVVLKETAAVMKKTMRDSDTVCRFGGEEFLVICPGANVEDAKLVGNRIRKAVQDNIITTKEFQGSVTISIGVGVKNSGHESAKDMIKDADEALYAAKEAGRNKVCIASPD
jgi:two-component system cell cycle response regulator